MKKISVSDFAKKQFKRNDVDIDKVMDTIKNPENSAVTDEVRYAKKTFDEGLYCYIVDYKETKTSIQVMSGRKVYSDLPGLDKPLEDLSVEEVRKKLFDTFGETFPDVWRSKVKMIHGGAIHEGEYTTWLVSHLKPEEAIKYYERLLQDESENPVVWYNKGNEHGKLEDHKKAIECYDKAIKIDSKNEHAWFNKGNSHRELGENEEALKCFDKALEINPKKEEAWINKGTILGRLKKHKKALDCFNMALKINPKNRLAIQNKKVLLNKLNK